MKNWTKTPIITSFLSKIINFNTIVNLALICSNNLITLRIIQIGRK